MTPSASSVNGKMQKPSSGKAGGRVQDTAELQPETQQVKHSANPPHQALPPAGESSAQAAAHPGAALPGSCKAESPRDRCSLPRLAPPARAAVPWGQPFPKLRSPRPGAAGRSRALGKSVSSQGPGGSRCFPRPAGSGRPRRRGGGCAGWPSVPRPLTHLCRCASSVKPPPAALCVGLSSPGAPGLAGTSIPGRAGGAGGHSGPPSSCGRKMPPRGGSASPLAPAAARGGTPGSSRAGGDWQAGGRDSRRGGAPAGSAAASSPSPGPAGDGCLSAGGQGGRPSREMLLRKKRAACRRRESPRFRGGGCCSRGGRGGGEPHAVAAAILRMSRDGLGRPGGAAASAARPATRTLIGCVAPGCK